MNDISKIRDRKAPTRTAGTKMEEPMKLSGNSYGSVSEMVRGVIGPEFAEQFEHYRQGRQLINALSVVRCLEDVGQEDIAGRMGCHQSKVSKMESSADTEINFGDIVKYSLALHRSIHVAILPMNRNGADHIRFHMESIKHELNRLFNIAGDDQQICSGVEDFAIQQARQALAMIEGLLDKLPRRAQSGSAVQVEVQGRQGSRLDLDDAEPSRKPRKPRNPAKKKAVETAV